MALEEGQELELSEPQRLFARSKFRFPAFVGGFGSGKTFAGALRALSLKSQIPGVDVCYYLPTYGLVKDIALPRFGELMEHFKIRHTLIRSSPQEIFIPDYRGSIKFRTLDQPDKIVGYEVGHSIIDELDTLPEDKAEDAWNKIIARNRAKNLLGNSIGVVTTPEGFRFVYRKWVKTNRPGSQYRLYRAKTKDNARFLPDGYIQSLEDTYPTALLQAYLNGEFVNLTQGSIYTNFSRDKNRSEVYALENEPLHIGMDFNVGKMAAVVHVERNQRPHAVDEIVNAYDTPDIIKKIRVLYPENPILVYPDASGSQRKTNNASASDIALLKAAKFNVCVNPRNPAVKDRIISMQKAFEDKVYRVNSDKCPNYTEALERQTYDNHGEPDKKSGFDHPNDAGGYYIAYRCPVVRHSFTSQTLRM